MGGSELCGKDMLENYATMVPYCVVLGVLVEQAGGELQGGIRIVGVGDLGGRAARQSISPSVTHPPPHCTHTHITQPPP